MRSIAILVALASCGGERAVHEKPSAPVDVTMTSRPLGGDAFEVTLTARPTRDVAALELTLDGRRADLGATRRGQARTMTAEVRLDGPRRVIVGGARAGGRSRAAIVELGEPAPVRALPRRQVTLPDGVVVDEVRP